MNINLRAISKKKINFLGIQEYSGNAATEYYIVTIILALKPDNAREILMLQSTTQVPSIETVLLNNIAMCQLLTKNILANGHD